MANLRHSSAYRVVREAVVKLAHQHDGTAVKVCIFLRTSTSPVLYSVACLNFGPLFFGAVVFGS